MRKISIASLHEVAPLRLPGYVEAVRARGKIEGNLIVLSDADFADIRRQDQLPGMSHTNHSPLSKHRFEICKSCKQASDDSFGCAHHKGCCFGQWRSRPENKCPEGKW